MKQSNVWVIVLAAGEGRRLQALTTTPDGVPVPKQYCSFGRREAMIHWALRRARAVAPVERIVTIVAREHARWWEPELRDLPRENVIVQPRNRGTAAGILLPLIDVLRRDPEATVVVLPSDHHVDDEARLATALARAVEIVRGDVPRAVLLGVTADEAEPEYGWILPGKGSRGCGGRPVARFVEKPDVDAAAELQRRGAVWNSFMFAASARTLLYLCESAVPEVVEPFLRTLVLGAARVSLDDLYGDLPVRDFSRDVLESATESLTLLVVPACGWSDLGTPRRLRRYLDGVGRAKRASTSPPLSA